MVYGTFGIGLIHQEIEVLSNVAIASATMAQNETNTITFTATGLVDGLALFYDSDGDLIAVFKGTITDGAGSITIGAGILPVATYAAGQIVVYAVNDTGTHMDMDETLELEVAAPESAVAVRILEVLQGLLQNDSRFSDVNDEDIIIAAHPSEASKAAGQKVILLIPAGQKSEEATCTLDENTITIYAVGVVSDIRTDREDYTPLDDLQYMMQNIKQLVREQDDDPTKRLAGIARSLHAHDMGGEDMNNRGGTSLVGYTEIVVTVMTDENGDTQ